MRKLRMGLGMFLGFSVNVLWGQGPQPQLPSVPGSPASTAKGVEVHSAVKHDLSPALRNILATRDSATGPLYEQFQGKAHSTPKSTSPGGAVRGDSSPRVAMTVGVDILGLGQGFVGPGGTYQVQTAPPGANGAAGDTQYVQAANTSFAVFNEITGAVVYGPAAGNSLWSGFGGGCETSNSGNIVVRFDGRWIIAQTVTVSPYLFCLAVSITSDATGQYYRYAFAMPNLPADPKLGTAEGLYFASFNMFSGTTFVGARVCGFIGSGLENGTDYFDECVQLDPSVDSLLPADLDGDLGGLIPPGYYMNLGTNSLNLWQFKADWSNPADATFVGPTNIPVAPFTEACNGGACIPQLGTAQTLDSVGDRAMYRFVAREFSGTTPYQSLLAVHSVAVGNSVGLRWYELRVTFGNTPSIYQEGTYAPDSNYRWMGSIAMDNAGDIAVGYSVSGSGMNPAIRYTGRVPSDALGTLQAENSIVEGGGSQLPPLSRWGDFSSMSVDPVDNCTFWYTNEYLQTNGTFNWSTRIASFKFPNCVPTNRAPSSISVSPSSGSGSSQTFSFVYGDPNGAADLNRAYVSFNDGLRGAKACTMEYLPGSNQLFLQNDAGNALIGPGTPGAAGTLQNGQCILDLLHSSASSGEYRLTLNLALDFLSALVGPQAIFMGVVDNGGLSSSFQRFGNWRVKPVPDHPPMAVAVAPSSGSGSRQVFNFLYSDPEGAVDLELAYVLINKTLSAASSCVVVYLESPVALPSTKAVALLNDEGNAWLGPAVFGSLVPLQNSQCSVNLQNSSISTSGTSFSLNLAMSFTSAFSGTQNIFMYGADFSGQNSGWQRRGTWTVSGR